MSTVDPLVSFVETLKFGDFPKLLRLCEDKFTKSNRTTWSKRSEDKKMKYITCLSKVVNIVSGGETKECLEDFARGKRAKAFITSALRDLLHGPRVAPVAGRTAVDAWEPAGGRWLGLHRGGRRLLGRPTRINFSKVNHTGPIQKSI